MEAARLSTATLADVDDSYYFGADCRSCLRDVRLSLVRLRSPLGSDFPVANIRGRLKCSTCGSKQIIVTFLAPNHGGSSLAHLFNEEAQ